MTRAALPTAMEEIFKVHPTNQPKSAVPMLLRPELIQQIQSIIAQSREKAIRSVDTERVLMYWQIGHVIFEEEQQGEDRAGYGTFLIQGLADELQPQFGSGFSMRQLELCR